MSGIKTDDVKVGSGKLPKSFSPGNHVAKILNIEIRIPAFVKQKNLPVQYEIIMDMETEPVGGSFEGWQLDKDDESKGMYLGQTGRVKSREWPYKDGKGKSKKTGKDYEFSLVKDILVFIKMIEEECGSDFLGETSGKFDTVEEIVNAFNEAKPFKDIFLKWCIGGQMEMKDDGHPKYYMFLPAFKKGFKIFAKVEDADSVAIYDKQVDLTSKDGPATVAAFTADAGGAEAEGGEVPNWDQIEEGDNPFESASDDDSSFPAPDDEEGIDPMEA